MSIDDKLLDILCDPVTKSPVRRLPKEKLLQLNEMISQGLVSQNDGSKLDETLDDALITENNQTIYRVNDDIPIMLEDKGIPTIQLKEF